MDTSRLLFVHKDQKSKSLSSSSGAERKQIYRHVHTGRSKKQIGKLEEVGGQASHNRIDSATMVENEDTVALSIGHSQGWLAGSNCRPQKRPYPKPQSLSAGAKQSEDRHGRRPDIAIVHPHVSQHSLMPTTVGRSSADPFKVLPVPLDHKTFLLLQFFEHISHPRTWYPESRMSRGQLQSQDPPSMVIQKCLEHEMTTRTMLATSATQLGHLQGRAPSKDDAILIHDALGATQKYIASCSVPDQRLVMASLFLAYAECYNQNAQAARKHMQAVKAFSDQLGGLAALQPHLQWWALAADELITAQLLPAKPLFAASDVDPGPLDDPSKIDLNGCHHSTSSLIGATWVDQLPDGLLQVLSDLIDCLPQLEFVFSGQGDDADADVHGLRRWVHTRMWAIRARLLALETEGPIAEVLRLASLVWAYTLAPAGRRMTAQSIARRLKEAKALTSAAIWSSSGDLYQWVLVIGALGSVGDDNERRWFLHRINDASHDRYSTPDEDGLTECDLKSMMNRVLYLEAVHRPMLSSLAAELRNQTS